jgi:hypothetical protein
MGNLTIDQYDKKEAGNYFRVRNKFPKKTIKNRLNNRSRRAKRLDQWEAGTREEIGSGAIIYEQEPGSFTIDANTMYGLRKFSAKEICDAQSDLSGIIKEWVQEGIDEVIGEAIVDISDDLNALTAEMVVEKLQSVSITHEEQRQLVLETEAMGFSVEQDRELKPVLREYIERYRDSNEPEDLIAVGSAIRKYVAIMDMSDMASIASILESSHRAVLPVEVELELMKMIVRKFAANPPSSPNLFPKLAEQISDLTKAYLNPRILPQGKYAAVAMNGVQGLVSMVSGKQDEVLQMLKTLPFGWFRDQLTRRLERQVEEWVEKLGDEHFAILQVRYCIEQINPKANE